MQTNFSETDALQKEQKVLIITYYWPPAGGPGVQRWLKFVKYLPEFGVQPIVFIPENPTYPIVDEQLIEEVSAKAIIIKNKIFEPYQIASYFSKNKTKKISSGIIPNQKKQSFLERTMLWIRGNLFIPDARIYWVKPSVKFLENYIKENNIQTIVTSGPPHSLHLIGLELKQKLDLKWFADFRDPWTTIGYHDKLKLSKFAVKKHKKLESKVLNSADIIIVTSKTTKTEFEALTKKPIEVITNGFDVEKIVKPNLDLKFSLAHIGSFLSERNPKILWEVLSELVLEIESFKNNLQLKLIGAVSQEVLSSIEQFGLNDFVLNLGYISHNEAVLHQRKSQVLLLIEIDSEATKSIIPGKLFEYMVSERPIVAIGPKDSDFESIIKETNTGNFFLYNEKEALKQQIISHYNLFLNQSLKTNPIGLENYSRKKLTGKLASVLMLGIEFKKATLKPDFRKIFECERDEKYEEVYELYQSLYSENKLIYEVWKNFYFFLWNAIEYVPSQFQEKIEIRKCLQNVFEDGKKQFSEIADFNFIAGYTVSIFPYEYGDFYSLEIEGNKMLKKSTELEPDNLIYRLAYFGSQKIENKETYRNLVIKAYPEVLKTFNGNSGSDIYFRKVLNRIDQI